MFHSLDLLRLETRRHFIRNIKGTLRCSALGYSSWKQLYIGHVGYWPQYCCVYDCDNNSYGGAHVRVKTNLLWYNGVFIVPMCTFHNNSHNEDWLKVKDDTVAVLVNERETSGSRGTCF